MKVIDCFGGNATRVETHQIPAHCDRCYGSELFLYLASRTGIGQSVGPNGSNARIVQQQGLTGKGIHIAMLIRQCTRQP